MENKAALNRANGFKKHYDQVCKEYEDLNWWDFKKKKELKTRARWANYHYSKNMKIYNESLKNKNGEVQE